MATKYGVDSVSATYTQVRCQGNYTTLANCAKNIYFGAGAPIVFFGRYFSPSLRNYSLDKQNVPLEAQSIHNVGIHWIPPLCAPTGGIGGTYAQGHADGVTVCATISYVVSNVPNSGIYIPGNHHLTVYLDVEQNRALSQNYWNGWANAVYYARWGSWLPYYPGIYCNPPSGIGNPCGVASSGPIHADGIWSNQPEYCSYCTSGHNFPGWAPSNCSGRTTTLWQYAEDGPCRTGCGNRPDWPNLDLDQSGPTRQPDETYFMLWVP